MADTALQAWRAACAPRSGRHVSKGRKFVPPAPCRLENNFEAELQRTGGAQRKHTRPQPNQVRTVSPRRAVQSSRSSIQDAAKRLARRVEVLAIEEIVDADLRLKRHAIPTMDWFDLPSEL